MDSWVGILIVLIENLTVFLSFFGLTIELKLELNRIFNFLKTILILSFNSRF